MKITKPIRTTCPDLVHCRETGRIIQPGDTAAKSGRGWYHRESNFFKRHFPEPVKEERHYWWMDI